MCTVTKVAEAFVLVNERQLHFRPHLQRLVN